MRLLCLLIFIPAFYDLCGSSGKADIDSLHQRAYRLLDSNPDSALVLGQLAAAKAADDRLGLEEATALFIQAFVYREKQELGKAFILYLKALELLRPLGSEKAKLNYAKILLNTGEILVLHHAYPQAIQYFDEGIRVAQEFTFNERLLKFYLNKAEALRQIKKFDQALTTIASALDLAQMEKHEKRILSSLNQQGLILKDMGRYEDSRHSYQQIIDFKYDQASPEKHRGEAWHNMAVTYLEEENYEEAEIAYLNALAEKQGSDERGLFITWMDLGETYYLMGRHKQAHEAAQNALALYDEVLLLPDHYALFSLLSKITYSLGEHEQSHAYNQRFEAVNKRFLQDQKEILQVKDQYKMEILTAGFFLEIKAAETQSQYQTMLVLVIVLAISVIFFISLFGYEKVRQYKVRRSIKNAILDIEREFDV